MVGKSKSHAKEEKDKMSDYRACGLYVRVSTDKQAIEGESLEEQEQKLKDFCKQRNWNVVKVYCEEGRSAKDTNRPKFKELLKDVENRVIDTVVVKKLDRLSRSIIDFERIYNFLESHNVDLVSLHENFDTTTAMGRAVIRIVMVFAQLEREQTSERTLDVLEHRAKDGLWNGGYPPLGYDLNDGHLVVNPKEAEIVRIIFQKYLEVASYRKVAEFLNSKGYKTKEFESRRGKKQGGNEFIDTYIARILKNPVYIGKLKYNGVIYQGKHTPLINEDTFSLVQDIISKNAQRAGSIRHKTKHVFLLNGLVKCKGCGSYMTPTWAMSKGERYFYYECTTMHHKGRRYCSGKGINARVLEGFVIKRIEEISRNEILLQRIVSRASGEASSKVKELEEKRILLKLRIGELEKKGSLLTEKLITIKGQSAERFILKEMENLDKELKGLEEDLKGVESEIDRWRDYVVNAEVIKESFRYFSRIFSQLSPQEKRSLLRLLVKEIIFSNTEITINFFEVPEEELQLESIQKVGFDQPFKWLRRQDSNLQPSG